VESQKKATHTKGIQAPCATLAMEAKDATKVIGKDCTSKPRAIDETRCLEDILFLLGELLHAVGIIQSDILWIFVGTTLIDL
jgi:hypothetical protein